MERQFKLLICGALVVGSNTLEVVNPAAGRAFAPCPRADKTQLDQAVAAARGAFLVWSATTVEERVGKLEKLAANLEARVGEFASLLTAEQGKPLDYFVDTMNELPRVALVAGQIAEEARFFSFGTNDLNQTTLGVSRNDAARFLAQYVEKDIYARHPFVSLDVEGVGQLIEIAAERGRAARPDIKLGICGEHGGDPASIAFCEKVGIDVSANPFRVPIARLAAAQAALRGTALRRGE